MFKYYASGSIIVIFIILGIIYKTNKNRGKKSNYESLDNFEEFNGWGQFIVIDQ